MKFRENSRAFNAIPAILEIFDTDPKPLKVEQVDRVMAALYLAGIECEHQQEAVECLLLLKDMQVLSVREEGKTYIVGNTYGKKT